jgi:mannose-6-phosphate isomerase-like protein (cupin superfamily)
MKAIKRTWPERSKAIYERGLSGTVSGGMIEVIEYTGPAAPPAHVHKEHDEVFVILNGSFRFIYRPQLAER